MKFSLTITDMTEDDVYDIISYMHSGGEKPQPAPQPKDVMVDIKSDKPFEIVDKPNDIDEKPKLDSSGLPWDDRIHASTKTTKKDGTWKARKRVDDETKTSVEQELRAKVKQDMIPDEANEPEEQLELDPTKMFPRPEQEQPAPAPVEQEQPAPAPVEQEPVKEAFENGSPVTFQDLMVKLQQGLSSGKIRQEYAQELVAQINQTYGSKCVSIVDVAMNQTLVDAAYKLISEKVA